MIQHDDYCGYKHHPVMGQFNFPLPSLMKSLLLRKSQKMKWTVFLDSYFILKQLMRWITFWSRLKEKVILALFFIIYFICAIEYFEERLFTSRLIDSNNLPSSAIGTGLLQERGSRFQEYSFQNSQFWLRWSSDWSVSLQLDWQSSGEQLSNFLLIVRLCLERQFLPYQEWQNMFSTYLQVPRSERVALFMLRSRILSTIPSLTMVFMPSLVDPQYPKLQSTDLTQTVELQGDSKMRLEWTVSCFLSKNCMPRSVLVISCMRCMGNSSLEKYELNLISTCMRLISQELAQAQLSDTYWYDSPCGFSRKQMEIPLLVAQQYCYPQRLTRVLLLRLIELQYLVFVGFSYSSRKMLPIPRQIFSTFQEFVQRNQYYSSVNSAQRSRLQWLSFIRRGTSSASLTQRIHGNLYRNPHLMKSWPCVSILQPLYCFLLKLRQLLSKFSRLSKYFCEAQGFTHFSYSVSSQPSNLESMNLQPQDSSHSLMQMFEVILSFSTRNLFLLCSQNSMRMLSKVSSSCLSLIRVSMVQMAFTQIYWLSSTDRLISSFMPSPVKPDNQALYSNLMISMLISFRLLEPSFTHLLSSERGPMRMVCSWPLSLYRFMRLSRQKSKQNMTPEMTKQHSFLGRQFSKISKKWFSQMRVSQPILVCVKDPIHKISCLSKVLKKGAQYLMLLLLKFCRADSSIFSSSPMKLMVHQNCDSGGFLTSARLSGIISVF